MRPREVVEHGNRQVVAAALLQAEHREIRVPVVDLVEAAARHDVAMRQREPRRVRPLILGLALQHFPQRIDVLAHVLTRHGVIFGAGRRRRREMRRDELAQIEVRPAARLAIFGEHLLRRADGQCVDEALAVRVDVLELHVLEQLAVDLRRCFDIGRVRDLRQGKRQQNGECPHGLRVSSAAKPDVQPSRL